jgi:hypothetical protein
VDSAPSLALPALIDALTATFAAAPPSAAFLESLLAALLSTVRTGLESGHGALLLPPFVSLVLSPAAAGRPELAVEDGPIQTVRTMTRVIEC